MTPFRMTSLIVATAATALIAAPAAEAKAKKQRVNSEPPLVVSFISKPPYPHIFHNGRDVGTDPDINVRAQMLRDPGQFIGGNW